MSFDIKLPNISATTDRDRILQIHSYLYQLVEQLNWALNSIETSGTNVIQQTGKTKAVEVSEDDAQANFNSVKSLIIKSADIVNTYYEEINKRLVGQYVAQSEFGTYVETTNQSITNNSQGVERMFNSIQEIITDIEGLENKLIEANAHIRSGRLYYDEKGAPVYGFEVGQINHIDGVEVFNKYARFTSDRLSFYDKNDTEVAYISDYKLYITNAHIAGTLTLGRFVCDTSDGLVIKWV